MSQQVCFSFDSWWETPAVTSLTGCVGKPCLRISRSGLSLIFRKQIWPASSERTFFYSVSVCPCCKSRADRLCVFVSVLLLSAVTWAYTLCSRYINIHLLATSGLILTELLEAFREKREDGSSVSSTLTAIGHNRHRLELHVAFANTVAKCGQC